MHILLTASLLKKEEAESLIEQAAHRLPSEC